MKRFLVVLSFLGLALPAFAQMDAILTASYTITGATVCPVGAVLKYIVLTSTGTGSTLVFQDSQTVKLQLQVPASRGTTVIDLGTSPIEFKTTLQYYSTANDANYFTIKYYRAPTK